jgi:hypothetical protein
MACNESNTVVDSNGNVLVENSDGSTVSGGNLNSNVNNNKYTLQSDSYLLQSKEDGSYSIKIFKGLSFTVDGNEAKSKATKFIQLVDSFGSVVVNTNITDDNGNLKSAGTLHYKCGVGYYVKLSDGKQMVRGSQNQVKTFFDVSGGLTAQLKNKLEICGKTKKANLPIVIKGSYKVPENIDARGDALHSFDRRASDKFGGYMFRTDPVPAQWASYVKVGTQGGTYAGKGVNQVLSDLISKGVKPDVTKISIKFNGYNVSWEVTIDESKDGKTWAGVSTRGSAGSGADQRAANQIPELKASSPSLSNWTTVLDLNVTSPIKIRQYFLKYTSGTGTQAATSNSAGENGNGSGKVPILSGSYVTATDKNPFNLVPLTPDTLEAQWNGTTGKKKASNSGKYFVVFDNIDNGIRGGMKNLSGYFTKYNLDTIQKILTRYDSGYSEEYKKFVVEKMKTWKSTVTFTSKLPAFKGKNETNADNIKMFKTLVKAIHQFEGGSSANLQKIQNYPISQL